MTPQLILLAGPYRSGTGGDAARIAANLARLEQAALAVYRRGHVPLIAEWVSLPLATMAGSKQVGDAISETFLYPAAHRLLHRCDAVLRIDGESTANRAARMPTWRSRAVSASRSIARSTTCRPRRPKHAATAARDATAQESPSAARRRMIATAQTLPPRTRPPNPHAVPRSRLRRRTAAA